jgi:uncharacterized protein (DUF305 family)
MMKILAALGLVALAQAPAIAQQSMDHSKMNHGASGQVNHGMMQMKNTAANPYAEAEMRMHQRMMQAMGSNPDETWARKMIEHHRGAIETGNVLLSKGSDQQLKAMARKSMAEQQKEIDELQKWLRTHGKNTQ